MRILRRLEPKNKIRVAWCHHADGQVSFCANTHMSRVPLGPDGLGTVVVADLPPGYARNRYGLQGIVRLEISANIVFQAALRPEGGVFRDRATGLRFTANDATAIRILAGAVTGQHPVEDGHILGAWTFRAVGSAVTLDRHEGEALAEAPAGAPDLSDFIHTLAREG